MFKSTDGGATWSAFNAGLTITLVTALAIDPATPTIVYAGTEGGGVFSIFQGPPPTLAVNYTSGAPGSFFAVTGSWFPPNSTTTIAINGSILGTIPTDASGALIFLLETSSTTDGCDIWITLPYSTVTTGIHSFRPPPVPPSDSSTTSGS